MSDASTEVVTRVELQGVQIKWSGPIRDCYLSLKDDVTALYGLNGAGKSHVLSAVAQSLRPDGGLRAFTQVKLGPDLFESEIEALAWGDLEADLDKIFDTIGQALMSAMHSGQG